MNYDEKLIYDVGLHKGEDTHYYLKRGFRVIAIEADEELVRFNEKRFENDIRNGKLIIINGAISGTKESEITFYKNLKVSVWGTVVKEWAERNANVGAVSIEVVVKVVRLFDLFTQYGIPYYLKIDIEGMDLAALKTLADCPIKPKYVSIESEKLDFNKLIEEFNVFEQLGYGDFNLVDQSIANKQKTPSSSSEGNYVDHIFEQGSSGLFASDLSSNWMSKDKAIKKYQSIFILYRLFGHKSIFKKFYLLRLIKGILQHLIRKPLPGWYDTHARLKSD